MSYWSVRAPSLFLSPLPPPLPLPPPPCTFIPPPCPCIPSPLPLIPPPCPCIPHLLQVLSVAREPLPLHILRQLELHYNLGDWALPLLRPFFVTAGDVLQPRHSFVRAWLRGIKADGVAWTCNSEKGHAALAKVMLAQLLPHVSNTGSSGSSSGDGAVAARVYCLRHFVYHLARAGGSAPADLERLLLQPALVQQVYLRGAGCMVLSDLLQLGRLHTAVTLDVMNWLLTCHLVLMQVCGVCVWGGGPHVFLFWNVLPCFFLLALILYWCNNEAAVSRQSLESCKNNAKIMCSTLLLCI